MSLKNLSQRHLFATGLMTITLLSAFSSCGRKYDSSLPGATDLGNVRGYRMARIITHYHSPYSYDACDKNGLPNGVLNQDCLDHLKNAVCKNKIDYVFLTDHPANQAKYEMKDLLLATSKDELLMHGDQPYASRLNTCDNGAHPVLMAGFEGKLLTFGMENHLSNDIQERSDLYGLQTLAIKTRLTNETKSLVVIPHTESRTFDEIKAVSPDGIEIYNIHANLDPKIRTKYLGVPPFEDVPSILTYLIDPYNSLVPDYMFLGFFKVHPVYAKRWNELIASGLRVVGFGGTDSHENIFPQKVSDGERLDSHRRLTRFMSNHYLVKDLDPDSVKSAMKQGRGWVVFEGFGSPVGMDFYAKVGEGVYSVGESQALSGGKAIITVKFPEMHRKSPQGAKSPVIKLQLKKVLSDGLDQVVATSASGDLVYTTQEPGAYRAEVTIQPKHLEDWLGPFSDLADDTYPWIITNHIYLDP